MVLTLTNSEEEQAAAAHKKEEEEEEEEKKSVRLNSFNIVDNILRTLADLM